jgi:hypothetical protein
MRVSRLRRAARAEKTPTMYHFDALPNPPVSRFIRQSLVVDPHDCRCFLCELKRKRPTN